MLILLQEEKSWKQNIETRRSRCKKYGANTIFLNVLKDSCMYNWYERHGFSDYCDNGVDKRYVRMVKHVDESTEY